jgi:hypothetical protein
MAKCNRSVATCRHDSIRWVTVSACKVSSNKLVDAEIGVELMALVVLAGGRLNM